MASEVLVDALPYYDQGYEDPGVREAAQSLVDEETRRYRPTKNYLEHLPSANYTAFETDVMKQEFERLQARAPMEVLSMKRYELPQPPAGKVTDFSSWQESVNNSHAQLEHQALRIMNLNLLSTYGPEVWKQHNDTLQYMLRSAQKQLSALKKEIQDINWNRKSEQTTTGGNLKELEERWVVLVGKNYEIESACISLEKELQALENSTKQ